MEQAYLPGTVRQRIQELIKERKITQAELAAEIGMAESTLSRFLSEKTDKIGDEYIIKIADFLGGVHRLHFGSDRLPGAPQL